MSSGDLRFLPAGKRFAPGDLVAFAEKESRTLEQAIAGADLLVCTPHSGSLIPAELAGFLAPGLTRRLQFDFTDVATRAVARRWAQIDRRIVAVENPHPRLVRDPNRPAPADLSATLREAFARVREAGPGTRVDLSGVDAVRPVMFNFLPLLSEPADAAEWAHLVATFQAVAERGLGVYERTRDALAERILQAKLAQAAETGKPGFFFTLSFHDTMNRVTRRDGAIAIERAPADRLPNVVALSNRGDHDGEPRGGELVTMAPELLRTLADAHRKGFAVADPGDVALNQPYLGGYEVTTFGAMFRDLSGPEGAARSPGAADAAGVRLGAVQAEFLREFLLGEQVAAELQKPGVDWPEPPAEWTDHIAHAMRASWDEFRTALSS